MKYLFLAGAIVMIVLMFTSYENTEDIVGYTYKALVLLAFYYLLKQDQMTKGDIMKLLYGENYTGIDSAIPQALWSKINTSIHVVNYNDSYGKLENIIKLAMEKELEIPQEIIDEEYKTCLENEEYFYNNYCKDEGMPWYTPDIYRKFQRTVIAVTEVEVKPYFNKV